VFYFAADDLADPDEAECFALARAALIVRGEINRVSRDLDFFGLTRRPAASSSRAGPA
jgi:hypothetical protein